MAGARIAIIGGGIQGVCAALALAGRGARVTVFEAAEALLDRASFRSEGKIHLGFVYANDPTNRTADLMLEAAMRFGPLVEAWTGRVAWDSLRSTPFTYATLPDSQLTPEQLRAHYERIDETYRTTYRGDGLQYLGSKPDTLLPKTGNGRVTRAAADWLAKGSVVAATAEAAVDRPRFRELMKAAVAAHARIAVRLRSSVETVARTANGFQLCGRGPGGGSWRDDFPVVVNCSWSDRLRLDSQQGFEPDRKWVYRLKFRLLGSLPGASQRPSLTFALGPYGDLVTYAGDRVYLSWYPVCMRGWSQELNPPGQWAPACRSATPAAEAAEITAGVRREFGAIIPAIRDVRIDDVGAGVIFSWGTRDIDDPVSELHRRSEIGVEGGNGYYTINTGKFTCAPLFADQLTKQIRADGGLD